MIASNDLFCVFRKDRPTKGGGVCIVLRKQPDLQFCEVQLSKEYQSMEILAVHFLINNDFKLRIVAFYFPPKMHNCPEYEECFLIV